MIERRLENEQHQLNILYTAVWHSLQASLTDWAIINIVRHDDVEYRRYAGHHRKLRIGRHPHVHI